MNGKKTFLFGIAVALVLPLSFYILAKVLGKDKLEMPVYYKGDQKLSSKEAMKLVDRGELKPVTDLQVVNQFGDPVDISKDFPNKMLLVNFFFTHCTSTCPKMMEQVKMLQYAFRRTPASRNDTTVQFLSISVDPVNDSASALRAYAKREGVDENRWWFLTGDKKTIYDWARQQLHLSVPAGDGGAEDFIHSNKLVLIDKDHFIRGYFDGLDSSEVAKCANDMGLLAMEKKHR
jgi:protein SCO1/2